MSGLDIRSGVVSLSEVWNRYHSFRIKVLINQLNRYLSEKGFNRL